MRVGYCSPSTATPEPAILTVPDSRPPDRVDSPQILQDLGLAPEALYDSAGCGFHTLDSKGLIQRINDTELAWLGLERAAVIGRLEFRALLTPGSQADFDARQHELIACGRLGNCELELQRADGRRLTVLLSATATRDARGRHIGSSALLIDISERKRAEHSAQRTFRALRVLSEMNGRLICADREQEFLDAVCAMVVGSGGYRMATIGYAMHDRERSVRPVAEAGYGDGYFERAPISWADNPLGQGPTGRAIRLGIAQINQNFLNNPQMLPWRTQALARGYQSSIALPLKAESDAVFGALSIYAAEPDAFDADEVKLLSELANDLAFGIRTVRARAEHQQAQAMIERLAYFDPLTGLSNRTRLLARLRTVLPAATRARPLALLSIGIERFDDIQTGIGLRPADRLLAQVADRLRACTGNVEVLARTGSKSFAVLLADSSTDALRTCAARIHEAMALPFQLAGIPLSIEVSIGAAMAPQHGDDPEALLLRSGLAARQASRSGAVCEFYAGSSAREDTRWLALLGDLRLAIERGELAVHYQPKIDVRLGRISGAEALLRWQHPQRGAVSPAEFMPIAEQTGLIAALTDHVLDQVLRQLRAWTDTGFVLPVAVNVSVRNFADPAFVDRVLAAVVLHGVDPALLQLELTESVLMAEPDKTREQLLRLDAGGVTVSIDDFGTGYSSLSYLARLPVRSLKIDRSFVIHMLDSPRVHGVVAATISMAEALAIRAIAEGVETRAQLAALIALGCDEVQGWVFCPALPADALRDWVAAFEPAAQGLAGASANVAHS